MEGGGELSLTERGCVWMEGGGEGSCHCVGGGGGRERDCHCEGGREGMCMDRRGRVELSL